MKEFLENFANRYGFFVIGGLIGAIIHRIRTKMSIKTFVGTLFTSAFIGLCVGILTRNYLKAPDEVVFVVCSMAGVFSKDLLDEVKQIISFASVYVKKLLKINEEKSELEENEQN